MEKLSEDECDALIRLAQRNGPNIDWANVPDFVENNPKTNWCSGNDDEDETFCFICCKVFDGKYDQKNDLWTGVVRHGRNHLKKNCCLSLRTENDQDQDYSPRWF